MPDKGGQPHKDHRFRISARMGPEEEAPSPVRHTGIRCSRSRQFRSNWIWHRHVECRRYLLRLVSL